jgi:glycine oxidase
LYAAGVSFFQVDSLQWQIPEEPRWTLVSNLGEFSAPHVCLAAGPWTPELLRPLGIDLPVEPRRGQIALWKFPEPLLHHVVNEGPRYLVPRDDGYLLAGSTVEEVGFDGATTDEGIAELREFAGGLLPCLAGVAPIQTWAGLRPWSIDGMPYLGRLPGLPGITIATGHFRSGIHLAPATGLLMKQLICDEPLSLPLAPFCLQR